MFRKPRLIGETEVLCIVLCWENGDRLVLAEEGVEPSHSTISGSFTVKRIVQSSRPWIQSEMATVEELVQMMNTLQGQHHASNQEISMLTAENLQFRQAGSPGLAEIASTVGQAVQTAISNANPRSNEGQSLVDIKVLGKPPTFEGESSKFTEWLRKATEGHGVSDCCLWLSFPASDRLGGRSRQRHHE